MIHRLRKDLPMTNNPLHTIMAPKSVAVVGASNNPMKMGTIQALTLMKSDYPGDIFPVHPTETQVFGKKAYKNIADLPYAPECVLAVVPSHVLIPMIDEFGKLGTRHAIIITAGFKETGEAGKALEKELLDTAARHGIRFLGPNCMGVFNANMPFNVMVSPFQDTPGGLSIASQSGTYLAQTLGYLRDRGIRVQKGMSVGNEANIDLADCLEYLGEDEHTKAIMLYIESLRDAEKFLRVARSISRVKPIVAQYVGGTKAGARSGGSHTGALAGPDFVYDGLFAQAGIIRVHSIEDAYRAGNALSVCPPLKGNRIAILTNSGGPGTAMSDMCDRMGLSVPPLPEAESTAIRGIIPAHASNNNPVDLTFVMDMSLLTQKIPQILFSCDEIDGVLLHGVMTTGWAHIVQKTIGDVMNVSLEQLLPYFMSDVSPLASFPKKYGKPLLTCSFMGREDKGVTDLMDLDIPCFDGPEKAAYAMGCLYRHLLVRTRPEDEAPDLPVPARAAEIMARANADNMDEHAAKELLSAYGIAVCREKLAHSAEEAVAAAREIGLPVAVKACSAKIAHKTEKGLVFLKLDTFDAVRGAFDTIRERAGKVPVLVCEMLKGDREFLAGTTRVPGFPPCVLFGLGGIFAEAIKDRAVRLAPFGREEGRLLAQSIKSADLLGPYRNMAPVDLDALADALSRLGAIATHFPQIAEMDLNPIMIVDGKPVVADALVVLE